MVINMTVNIQENLADKCYKCEKQKCNDDCEVLGQWTKIIVKDKNDKEEDEKRMVAINNTIKEAKFEKKQSVVRLDHAIADKIDNLILGHNYVHTRLDEYLEFLEDYCTTKCETIDKSACETCDINVYRTKALDSLEDLIEEKKEE